MQWLIVTTYVLYFFIFYLVSAKKKSGGYDCPEATKYGPGPPKSCPGLSDPNNRPKSPLEKWFTREMFHDLFPKANLGWGPHKCLPYSYEAFMIAARYFPRFGSDRGKVYKPDENARRDLAAFFAHVVQETGENDPGLYNGRPKKKADECFYRGGFFNWFEGGPVSAFLTKGTKGGSPQDGVECNSGGRYCERSAELDFHFPCGNETSGNGKFKRCYFGRGPIQLSYNYNYGQFNRWLHTQKIKVDLMKMTPQPPKPSMHDIVMGNWKAGSMNKKAKYEGPIFGPTSLIINNECHGEDPSEPGSGGESRRIKAFKWFCKYFNVPTGKKSTLSCKAMPQRFKEMSYKMTYQPDWSSTWKEGSCQCAPASYGGVIPYFDPAYYPKDFTRLNAKNKRFCEKTIYANPKMYSLDPATSVCLNTPFKSG